MSALKLVNLCKSFKQGNQEILALDNVNLDAKKGKMTALIGPSGSGKTTLLQIAGLLDKASAGEIFINEIDATKASESERTQIRRNNIGFIYQFHHLLPEFSALENVAMPLLIQEKNKAEAFEEARILLNEIGLKDRLEHKPSELSGGQQQRVAIARAIVSKPALILADEPTGNLDSSNSQNVFELLLNLTKSYGIACLLVTHNLELAKKSDFTVEIRDGRIV